MFSLSDLRGSGLIQRSPRPWGWSSPRPTPRWPRTSWLAPRTLLRPSKAPGHNSSAETPVSGHCLCTRRRRARVFPLCHRDWPLPVGGANWLCVVWSDWTAVLFCLSGRGKDKSRDRRGGGSELQLWPHVHWVPDLVFTYLFFEGETELSSQT